MSLTIAEIAEAFSDHRFGEVVPYLSDDVRWTVIGDRLIAGKAEVIAACDESAAYLATATTEFSRFKVVVGEDAAVVDARATYTDAEKNTFAVASCDIYEFADGKLSAITSYNVEVT
jgi:ketosteroid isomerase-like protein